MNRKLISMLAGVVFSFSAGVAHASVMLSFEPTISGLQLDVGVRISGLGNGAPPSLGAYDLDVSFDDVILDFAGLTFGDPVLGNQLDFSVFGSIADFSEDSDPNIGLVDFFEISLEPPGVLDSSQADSFIVATLTFDGTDPSSLSFASVVLSDSVGNRIAVPEPATLALIGLGLAGIRYQRRKGLSA